MLTERYIVATVTTNCEDDEYRRVKVKATDFWPTESPLMMVVNQVYLNKGDRVLVDVESGYGIIVGKLFDKVQQDNSPAKGDGTILYESKKDSTWIQARLVAGTLQIKNSKGVAVSISGEDIKIDGVQLTINGGNNGGLIKIDNNVSKLNNLENLVNSFITTYNTHTHTVATTGSATTQTGTAAPTTAAVSQTLTPTVKADLENTKVKH